MEGGDFLNLPIISYNRQSLACLSYQMAESPPGNSLQHLRCARSCACQVHCEDSQLTCSLFPCSGHCPTRSSVHWLHPQRSVNTKLELQRRGSRAACMRLEHQELPTGHHTLYPTGCCCKSPHVPGLGWIPLGA